MKHPTACVECRVTKRKCVLDPANLGSACLTCQGRSVQCSTPWKKRGSHSLMLHRKPEALPEAPLANSQSWEYITQLSSHEDIHEFVRLYFTYIHDRPHSLFHEQSLWQKVQDRSLPESLLAAICALGCRLSTHEVHRGLAAAFTSKSKSLLATQLENITICNIQTCILLANSYAAEQDNKLEALYFGIATRMAYVLGLHTEEMKGSPIAQEISCRVWWSLFMADRWCPPALGLPRAIMCPRPSIRLPMNEADFQELRDTDNFSPSCRSQGLWAYKTTLVEILASIQDMNLALVQDQVNRLEIDHQVERIAHRLQSWRESLPRHMVLSDENLSMYTTKGYGGAFVALHLGYHHYSTLLYFQYLELGCEPTIHTAAYAARCRFHGLSFSRLLHTARQLTNCYVVYLTVAHMTIVSSSVLLHLLLFGNDEEVETARLQLTRNFEALMDLAKYWPCVDNMKDRLFIFQNACLNSSVANTYAVDRWVVRFLLEYALPFRNQNGDDEASPQALALQYNEAHSGVPLQRRIMLDKALEDLRVIRE